MTSIDADTAAKFFRGLGDPNRIKILQLVQEKERSVSELVELLHAPQGRVSNHLTCLRWCGFVTTRKEGRQVFYQISDERVETILNTAQLILTETASQIDTCRIIEPTGSLPKTGAEALSASSRGNIKVMGRIK